MPPSPPRLPSLSPPQPKMAAEQPAAGGLRLQTVLVLPFVIQICLAVGLTGWLTIRNGQQAVNEVAGQLRSEVSARIQQKLTTYLDTPHIINQLNADAVSRGELKARDLASERYLWQQMILFDSITQMYYSTQATGEYIGLLRRGAERVVQSTPSDQSTSFSFHYYSLGGRGNRVKLVEVNSDKYEPRGRPWYKAAVAAGKPSWSEIYPDFSFPILDITAAQPVYDSTGKLLGVCAVDLYLSDINQFLGDLKAGKSGQTFIMERSGLLVASSAQEKPFTFEGDKREPKRIKATNTNNALTRAAARYVAEHFGDLKKIGNGQQLDFKLNGQRQFLQVTPFQDGRGLDWLIVVAVPESDFTAQIDANTRATILLCLGALGLAILLGWLTSRWITQPILRLSDASKAIAEGKLDQRVELKGVYELGILSQSFNNMAAQLRESFLALEKTNAQLEQRVEQRTSELRTANRAVQEDSEALQAEMGRLLEVVSAVEEGDLTVQAKVSPRATGLVADTFNRLIEQMSRVLMRVLGTARQVNRGAKGLEELAKTVAVNAELQSQSVTQVQSLTEQVERSARHSAQQVELSNQSLFAVRSAVEQGQTTINQLTLGIDVLQMGTAQLVQRMKTLGEFVNLADQFVQEQAQIASLTRVLSISATLATARAAEQRDPNQFVVVAREFETITAQVNALAAQTNEGLAALQNRTTQIHQVVSAIDADIQSLSGLVSGFNTGVEQSSHVFSNVQTVTAQVVKVGQEVALSNQEIVNASQSTAQSVREIAVLAERTADLTRQAQLQSERMEGLARRLLSSIQFFRLPAPMHSEIASGDDELNLNLSQFAVQTLNASAEVAGSEHAPSNYPQLNAAAPPADKLP